MALEMDTPPPGLRFALIRFSLAHCILTPNSDGHFHPHQRQHLLYPDYIPDAQ